MSCTHSNKLEEKTVWSAAYSKFVHSLLSPVATGGLWWACPPKQSSKPPTWNLKHYKSEEFLSIVIMSSLHRTNVKPHYWNFLVTVPSLLLIHLLSTRSPILSKCNKNLNSYVRSGNDQTKLWVGQNVWFWVSNSISFEILPLKHKMTRYSKHLEGPWPTGPPDYAYVRAVYTMYM